MNLRELIASQLIWLTVPVVMYLMGAAI